MPPIVQGALQQQGAPVRHIFERLPCSSPASASDVHFKHFCEVVWPRVKGSGAAGEPTKLKPV